MKKPTKEQTLLILNIVVIIITGWILFFTVSNVAPQPKAKPLYQADGFPEHKITSVSLAPKNGHAIDVIVSDTDFTMKKCRDFIELYREAAGPEGTERGNQPRHVCIGCAQAFGAVGAAGRASGGTI